MKKITTLILLSALSLQVSAQTCRGSNCPVAGLSAAGAMTAGVVAIRGRIATRDIEKRFTRYLFRVSAAASSLEKNVVSDNMINKVRPGDKVIITYSQSNHLNVNSVEIALIDSRLDAISQEMAELSEAGAKIEKGQTVGFHNPQSMKADYAQIRKEYKALSSVFDGLTNKKASLMKNFAITRSPMVKVILDANDNVAGHELKSMILSGKSIYSVQRVPNAIMKKLARASRNGWLLAATAVGLGLVTAEELSSGIIARNLDAETKSMK